MRVTKWHAQSVGKVLRAANPGPKRRGSMLCPERWVNHAKVAICSATLVVTGSFFEPARAGDVLRPFGNAGYSQAEHDLVTAPAETGTRKWVTAATAIFQHGISVRSSCHLVSCCTLLHVPLVRGKCCLQWERRVNFRAGTVGFNNQIAAKMAHAFAHSSDSHSRALGLNLSQSFLRHTPSMVFNLYVDIAFLTLNSNPRGFASRVTMNVGQAFLHQPE